MLRFNNLVRMGQVGSANEFLPVHFSIDATFRLLGNVIDGSYTAVLDYKEISQKRPGCCAEQDKKQIRPVGILYSADGYQCLPA